MFTAKFFQLFLCLNFFYSKLLGIKFAPSLKACSEEACLLLLEALGLNPGCAISVQLLYLSGLQL